MLSGVRIVEFEALGPAPFAGAMLAELGAEVIVIHRADGVQSPARTGVRSLIEGASPVSRTQSDEQVQAPRCARRALVRVKQVRPAVMKAKRRPLGG